jgi:hypothetical protein
MGNGCYFLDIYFTHLSIILRYSEKKATLNSLIVHATFLGHVNDDDISFPALYKTNKTIFSSSSSQLFLLVLTPLLSPPHRHSLARPPYPHLVLPRPLPFLSISSRHPASFLHTIYSAAHILIITMATCSDPGSSNMELYRPHIV